MYPLTDTDQFPDDVIVALTLYGEAEGEGIEGQTAVCNVILTRASLDWSRNATPRLVCLQHEQFSCWNKSCARRDILMDLDQTTDLIFAQCLSIARSAIAGNLADNTNGADSYEVTGTGAYWSKGLTPVAVIGRQSFYITRPIAAPPLSA